MKKNSNIKYLSHDRDSVFKNLDIRENPDDAFDNAIKKGMKNPDDWMYMYSKNCRDYFKHCDTRRYISYLQDDNIKILSIKYYISLFSLLVLFQVSIIYMSISIYFKNLFHCVLSIFLYFMCFVLLDKMLDKRKLLRKVVDKLPYD